MRWRRASRPSSSAAGRRPSPSLQRSSGCSPRCRTRTRSRSRRIRRRSRPALAALLSRNRVNRVSHRRADRSRRRCSRVLERRAQPEDVRRAVYVLRDAGFDNISLDLVYGIPGQSSADLEADLAEALALEPEHLSCYELEAKPGTRFTHAHGAELERQAESMETYFERVVETLTRAGYRWYETANFCRGRARRARPARAAQPRLLARTGLPRARDRRGLDNRGHAAAEHAAARRLPRRARGRARRRRGSSSRSTTTSAGASG